MSNKLKRKRKKKETVWSAGKKFTGYVLDGGISIFMLILIVVLPFYFEEGYSYIGTNKSYFFRNVGIYGCLFLAPLLVLYLIFTVVEKRQSRPKTERDTESKCTWKRFVQISRQNLSVTDGFALLYGVSLLLSYVCSDYKDSALWGATGWFMGLLTQLILLGIYFLISRFWKSKNWMFYLFLPVSAVVFGLGYLNRFGIYPIDMQLENPEFISTIGNINWYCGYLVSVFFGGYYLLWQSGSGWNRDKKSWKKALLMLYVAVGFATLVTQGSVSGLVTLAVMMIVTFCLSAKDSERMLLFWQETMLLSLACLLTFCVRNFLHGQINYIDAFVDLLTNSAIPVIAAIVSGLVVMLLMWCEKKGTYPIGLMRISARITAVGSIMVLCLVIGMIIINTMHPGSLGALSDMSFFTFSPDWGSNRGATWKAAVMCFSEQDLLHKVVGVGPDSMEAFLYGSGSAKLNQLVAERFGILRLKNAHNEWLNTLVNMGVLGFASYVGMMVSAIWRFLKRGLKGNVMVGACGFCLLAYTINNMFSFQQSVSAATIFVILGIGEAYMHLLFDVSGGKIK